VDIDVFVAAHRAEWARLEELVRRAGRPRQLRGAEVDELVALYQRTATHLSVVQSRSPDPLLIGRLSTLVARARAAVTGAGVPAWRDAARFLVITFPVVVYRARWWWLGAALGSLLVAFALGVWVDLHPQVQAAIAAPAEVKRLVEHDFANYYSENPAGSFAARVWTNNAWVAAGTLSLGVFLGLPTLWILLQNATNVGVAGGLMAASGRSEQFFGLILPHGMLELTAVFVAAGVGLRLGWTVVDPGRRSRLDALATEGRAAFSVALGLVLVLLVSGAIEAFVTPSSLPTWGRIGVGLLAETVFLAWVLILGRRAAVAGETGDLLLGQRPDVAPVVG
jgi:uncharacterized membrane protein SpoIIM required for sporulation